MTFSTIRQQYHYVRRRGTLILQTIESGVPLIKVRHCSFPDLEVPMRDHPFTVF